MRSDIIMYDEKESNSKVIDYACEKDIRDKIDAVLMIEISL